MNDSVIGMACPVACDRGWGVLKVCIIDKTVSVSITHLWHRCHRFGGNRLTVAYITTGSVSITTAKYHITTSSSCIDTGTIGATMMNSSTSLLVFGKFMV